MASLMVENGDGAICDPCRFDLPPANPSASPPTLKVYPNPAQASTTLQWQGLAGEEGWLTVVSNTGAQYHAAPLPHITQRLTLDTHKWPAGLYWLRVQHAEGVLYQPLLVAK